MESSKDSFWHNDDELELARATILHASHMPCNEPDAIVLMLVLEVRVRGLPPYQTAVSRLVSPELAGRLEAGTTLDVRVNPSTPTNVILDFRSVLF